ncbi:MAG: hypothetical protein RSA99_02985 [Oscillospiraceae bacterium]
MTIKIYAHYNTNAPEGGLTGWQYSLDERWSNGSVAENSENYNLPDDYYLSNNNWAEKTCIYDKQNNAFELQDEVYVNGNTSSLPRFFDGKKNKMIILQLA